MSLRAFNKLLSLLSPLLKEMMRTPEHQLQSHQLSLLELGSGTLQEAKVV